MGKSKNWIVVTSNGRATKALCDKLTKAGLKNINVLEEIGTITGTADEAAADKLRRVPGVVDISEDGEVHIGPPGSKTTW